MDSVTQRPTFTQQQIERELRQVVLLDRILAERGAMTLKDLYDVASGIDAGVNFKNSVDLTSFIRLRSNAFEMSFDRVRNRSQEFREMFGYLVNFLGTIEPSKRNVELVIQAVGRFDTIVAYEVGNSEEEIFRFLNKHKNFFITYDNGAVILNPICLQVPSAWERGALPTYKKNVIRYDKSIILDGIGNVVSAVINTRYVKIEIVRGPWKKQTVYGLSKNVSNEENLATKYPIGTLVKVLAYRAYEAAHPWTATKVISAHDCDDIWSVGETGRMDSLLAKFQCNKDNRKEASPPPPPASPPPMLINGTATPKFTIEPVIKDEVKEEEEVGGAFSKAHSNEETKMNTGDWEFYNDIIQDELKKGQEIDECLHNGPRTFRQIFDELLDRDTFSYYSFMVDFITVRSHLYETSDQYVCKRSKLYRDELLKFLRYVDKKSKENITVNALRKLIYANDGDFADELLLFAENADTFLGFIEQHGSLIELAEAFGEQFIFLRGTYSYDYNIFVPKFRFSQLVSDH